MGSRAAEVFSHFSGPRYMYFFHSIGNATPAGPWPNGIREPGASAAAESKHSQGGGSQGLAPPCRFCAEASLVGPARSDTQSTQFGASLAAHRRLQC
jgi:hypothetical protein